MEQHDRHGVRIDHCPTCGGVWLDKGELDSLIAAVRPSVVLPNPDPKPAPVSRTPKPAPAGSAPHPAPGSSRDTSKTAKKTPPKSGRYDSQAGKTRKGPGSAQRYGRRYSNRVRVKDILEEIFDFD